MIEVPGKFKKGADIGNNQFIPLNTRLDELMASFNFVKSSKNPVIWEGIGGRTGARAYVYGLDNTNVGGEGKKVSGVRIEISEPV